MDSAFEIILSPSAATALGDMPWQSAAKITNALSSIAELASLTARRFLEFDGLEGPLFMETSGYAVTYDVDPHRERVYVRDVRLTASERISAA